MFIVTGDFVDGVASFYQELPQEAVEEIIHDYYIELDEENIYDVDAEYWLTIQPDLESGKQALFKRWMDYVEGRIIDNLKWFGEHNTDGNPETIRKKMFELGKDILDNSKPIKDITAVL